MDTDRKNKLSLIILIIIFLIGLIIPLMGAFTQGSKAESIVPLFGLPAYLHLTIIGAIWPTVGAIALIMVFPFLLTPAFLKLKSIIWNKYTDAYMDIEQVEFDMKKFIKRIIYIFLLTFGIVATISGRIDMNLLLSEASKDYWVGERGLTAEYVPDAFMGIIYLIFPLIIGLWSIGWALEDTGLMHYKLPKDGKLMLYEIEPIHLKYNGIIKGYAGITAILFFTTSILYYAGAGTDSLSNVSTIVGSGIIVTFLSIPAYIIYWKFCLPQLTKMFRKGKEPITVVTESQLKPSKA